MKPFVQRIGILLALAACSIPFFGTFAQDRKSELKEEQFKGKVIPLADVLGKFGSKLDADAVPHWLALVTEEGKVYPLIKDAGSRMFFKDKTLLNRPMRLTGRLFPNSQMLQVLKVHSYKDGKLHDIYYWCDICTIKGFENVICDCCGAPMELREVPVKE